MKLNKSTETYVVIRPKNNLKQRPYFCFIRYKYNWEEYIFTSDGISGFPIGEEQEILKYYGTLRVGKDGLSDYQYRKYQQWKRQYHKDFPYPPGKFNPNAEGILSPKGNFFPCRYGEHQALAENLCYRFHRKRNSYQGSVDYLEEKGYIFWHPKSDYSRGFFSGKVKATKEQLVFISKYELDYYDSF